MRSHIKIIIWKKITVSFPDTNVQVGTTMCSTKSWEWFKKSGLSYADRERCNHVIMCSIIQFFLFQINKS